MSDAVLPHLSGLPYQSGLPYLSGPDAGRAELPSGLADVRLWAFDIDGTIAGADSVVSERTRAALRAVADSGAHVALVTGRAAASAEIELQRAGIAGMRWGMGARSCVA